MSKLIKINTYTTAQGYEGANMAKYTIRSLLKMNLIVITAINGFVVSIPSTKTEFTLYYSLISSFYFVRAYFFDSLLTFFYFSSFVLL